MVSTFSSVKPKEGGSCHCSWGRAGRTGKAGWLVGGLVGVLLVSLSGIPGGVSGSVLSEGEGGVATPTPASASASTSASAPDHAHGVASDPEPGVSRAGGYGSPPLHYSSPWVKVKKGDWGIYRLLGGTRMVAVMLVVKEVRSLDVAVEVSMIEADQNVTRQVTVPRKVTVEELAPVVLTLMDLQREGLQAEDLRIRAVPVYFGGAVGAGLALKSLWQGQVGRGEAMWGSREVTMTLSDTAPLLGVVRLGVADKIHLAGTVLKEQMTVELIEHGREESPPVS